MEKEEHDKSLADLETKIMGEVDKRLAALRIPVDPAAKVAELGAANDGLVKELAEAKKRIDALEKTPRPKTVAEERTKELEDAPVKKLPRIQGGSIVCE